MLRRIKQEGTTNLVAGDYLLLDLLGEGQYASVWRGWDLKRRRFAAVRLHEIEVERRKQDAVFGKDDEVEIITRWDVILREAEILSRLQRDCNHVVKVLGEGFRIDHASGLAMLATEIICPSMEFCEKSKRFEISKGLLKKLPKNFFVEQDHQAGFAFSEAACKILCKQLLTGLQQIHFLNVYHRDIKPQNIGFAFDEIGDCGAGLSTCKTSQAFHDTLGCYWRDAPLSSDENLFEENQKPEGHQRDGKVLARDHAWSIRYFDFNSAEISETGVIYSAGGSRAFQPPESFSTSGGNRKGLSGCKRDVWALGVTLYAFLFGGILPYWHEVPIQLCFQIMNDDWKLPPNVKLSLECENFLACILNRDPERRPEPSELLKHEWLLLS